MAPMLLGAFQGRAVWILFLGRTVRPREARCGDNYYGDTGSSPGESPWERLAPSTLVWFRPRHPP